MALGVVPSEIQRPATPSAVVASLAAGVSGGKELSLLKNYALEFSPYWMFSHPDVNFDDMLDAPFYKTLGRSLSVSFASGSDSVQQIQNGVSSQLQIAKAAVGARTTLFQGEPTTGAVTCLKLIQASLQTSLEPLTREDLQFATEWIRQNPKPKLDFPPEPTALDYPDPVKLEKAIEEWETLKEKLADEADSSPSVNDWTTRLNDARREFSRQYQFDTVERAKRDDCAPKVYSKKGFMADAAFAFAVRAPEGNFKNLRDQGGSSASTVWLTLGDVWENALASTGVTGTEFSLLGVLRYQNETVGELGPGTKNAKRWDTGLRFAVAARRFGLAGEGTYRRQRLSERSDSDNLYRAAVSVDYRVDSGMWVSATVGKDFGDTSKDAPLLALANLQWNFGLDRGIEIDHSPRKAP